MEKRELREDIREIMDRGKKGWEKWRTERRRNGRERKDK